jgi:protease I
MIWPSTLVTNKLSFNKDRKRLIIDIHITNTQKKRKMKNLNFLIILLAFALGVSAITGCNNPDSKKDAASTSKIAVIVAEGFHDTEAYLPMGYLINQGYQVTIIGPEIGAVKAYNTDFTIQIEKSIDEISPDDFDAIIFPGGKGPAVLRENNNVIEFVEEFAKTGKVIAAICHGPQVLITADVINGYKIGGLIKMKEEIESAGAQYVDDPVVVDRNIVTAKIPKDLFEFSKAIDKTIKNLN